MLKLILEILMLVVLVGGVIVLTNYLIYFWINRKRKWKQEDEVFNAKKKQEALKELMDTQNMLETAKEVYMDDKARRAKSLSEKLDKV